MKTWITKPYPQGFDSAGLRWSLRICISSQFPEDVPVAGRALSLRTSGLGAGMRVMWFVFIVESVALPSGILFFPGCTF